MRHGRVDANQAEIVAALRKVGASVVSIADIGKGCPDILVGFRGVNHLMELKTATGTLTDDEREWRAAWRGSGFLVRSVEEALRAIGAIDG